MSTTVEVWFCRQTDMAMEWHSERVPWTDLCACVEVRRYFQGLRAALVAVPGGCTCSSQHGDGRLRLPPLDGRTGTVSPEHLGALLRRDRLDKELTAALGGSR